VSSEPDRSADVPETPSADAGEGAVPGPQTADDAVEQSAESSDTAQPADVVESADGETADVPPAALPAETASEDAASEDEETEEVMPLEVVEEADEGEELARQWYILKVQVNREESIRDALLRRVKIEGLERFFGDIVVPTEDVAEFTKTGKRRIVKRKLYPGYIMVHMTINDDTWFLVRETPGIGDFTGSAGKPTPMDNGEVERILNLGGDEEDGESQVKTAIPFKAGDRVRVKEGYFQNFEGDVESVDEANGRVTVMINIFGRSTPVELEHWQIEAV
jgi:transcriptional antiterminator NusG